MKQKPRLMRSSRRDILYIVTKYDDFGHGNFFAIERFEVTAEEQRKLKIILEK